MHLATRLDRYAPCCMRLWRWLALLLVHVSIGTAHGRAYADGPGFFVGKGEIFQVLALPYVLRPTPVEDPYRAQSVLNILDLQSGAIYACVHPHQRYNVLPLFFGTYTSRLLSVSSRTTYATWASVHPPETLPFSAPCRRTSQTIVFPEQRDELLNLNHFHLIDFYRMRDRCGWRVENNHLSPLLSGVSLKHIGELVGPQ